MASAFVNQRFWIFDADISNIIVKDGCILNFFRGYSVHLLQNLHHSKTSDVFRLLRAKPTNRITIQKPNGMPMPNLTLALPRTFIVVASNAYGFSPDDLWAIYSDISIDNTQLDMIYYLFYNFDDWLLPDKTFTDCIPPSIQFQTYRETFRSMFPPRTVFNRHFHLPSLRKCIKNSFCFLLAFSAYGYLAPIFMLVVSAQYFQYHFPSADRARQSAKRCAWFFRLLFLCLCCLQSLNL